MSKDYINNKRSLIVPSKLKKGDTIGVIAPAGWTEEELLRPAIIYLKSRGYSVRLGTSLFTRNRYLSGSDDARVEDIHAMFADHEVNAIFCARGGYGSLRLLAKLDYTLVRENPKALVGFSDTTALQLSILVKAGLVSFTGMLLSLDITDQGMPVQTEETLWELLEHGYYKPIRDLEVLKPGMANGVLVGGCLSLLCSLIGTPYFPKMDGAILFIEDVSEEPYRIDRMLTQLRLAGVLDCIAGLIFGKFEGCKSENPQYGSLHPVFTEFADAIDGPILCGLPYGHVSNRIVLPIGVEAHISADRMSGEVSIMKH